MELAAANNEDEEGEEDLVVKDKTKVGENDNNVDNEILPHPPIEVKSKRKNKKKNTYGIVTDDEIHVPSSLKPVISTDEEDVDWSTGGKSNKRKGGGGGKKSLAKDKRSFKLSSSSTSQQSTTDNNDSQLTADADGAVDNLTEVMVGSKISLDTDDQNNKKKGESTSDHVCNVCKSGFPSRSKLFDHINATGHALAESLSQIGGGGKRGKRK